MKHYKKPLVALVLLSLGVQSYADELQTSVGASHTTPKVIRQTQNSTTSYSLEIKPYGKLSDVNQAHAETIGIDFEQNPFIYGSGYHDTESNLEYMGARYYSADTGRFMAQDSYDLINRYNYVNANPIMYIDPDGHSAVGDFFLSMIPGYGTYHAFANDRPWYEKAIAIGMDVAMLVGMAYGFKSLYQPASLAEAQVVGNARMVDQLTQIEQQSRELVSGFNLDFENKLLEFIPENVKTNDAQFLDMSSLRTTDTFNLEDPFAGISYGGEGPEYRPSQLNGVTNGNKNRIGMEEFLQKFNKDGVSDWLRFNEHSFTVRHSIYENFRDQINFINERRSDYGLISIMPHNDADFIKNTMLKAFGEFFPHYKRI